MSNFSTELYRLMTERGLGVRETARRVPCNAGYISNLRSGRKQPSAQTAGRLDVVLNAGGRLAELARQNRAQDGTKAKKRSSPTVYQVAASDGLRIDVGALVMAAAHESSDQATDDARKLVPNGSIEYLRTEVIRLARGFGDVSPLVFLMECRQLRDLAFQLVERTNQPSQRADLYLVTGQLCALMAEASFDLAVWPAVIEQAHAASLYGEMVGCPSLQAWAQGMQAITAYWRSQSREAVQLAEAGVLLAPSGSPRARLLSISARAWAHVGNVERTRTALALADRDRDAVGASGRDELHDEIGGQFAWGPARQAMSAASALLTIGDARGAARCARDAIRLQPQDQAARRVGVLARADLAYAELVGRQVDAAEATLAPIWGLEPEQRRFALIERLGSIANLLAKPPFARDRPLAAIVERIAVFTADAAPKTLPPGGTTIALPRGE
jgi:transcriptional regulator with XRE-family HTH domain